jgi:hypothetical protein
MQNQARAIFLLTKRVQWGVVKEAEGMGEGGYGGKVRIVFSTGERAERQREREGTMRALLQDSRP